MWKWNPTSQNMTNVWVMVAEIHNRWHETWLKNTKWWINLDVKDKWRWGVAGESTKCVTSSGCSHNRGQVRCLGQQDNFKTLNCARGWHMEGNKRLSEAKWHVSAAKRAAPHDRNKQWGHFKNNTNNKTSKKVKFICFSCLSKRKTFRKVTLIFFLALQGLRMNRPNG